MEDGYYAKVSISISFRFLCYPGHWLTLSTVLASFFVQGDESRYGIIKIIGDEESAMNGYYRIPFARIKPL